MLYKRVDLQSIDYLRRFSVICMQITRSKNTCNGILVINDTFLMLMLE
jgi:hypothetical protein